MNSVEPSPSLPLCPPWCTGEHEMGDDLRLSHRSEGVIVPGVERVITAQGGGQTPTVTEIAIGLEYTAGETWVWFGPERPLQRTTVLSVESTRRMLREMERLLLRLG